MNIMRFVIKWMVFCRPPTGFSGIVALFVGGNPVAFHNLPIVRRPYGTLQH